MQKLFYPRVIRLIGILLSISLLTFSGFASATIKSDYAITQAEYNKQLDAAGLLVDGIGGALYTPNGNGLVGDAAQFASPYIAKQIGDYFAEQGETGSASQGLAHAVLAAAVIMHCRRAYRQAVRNLPHRCYRNGYLVRIIPMT